MKVVFVHQDANVTGSAISMLNLIKGFRDKVSIHVVLPEKGPLVNLLNEEQIPFTIVPFVRFWSTPGPKWHNRQTLTQFKAIFPDNNIKQEILSLQPDIIHLNDKACMQVGISLHGVGIPIVQHLRSSYFTTHFFLNKWISIYSIKRYADQIIAISEDEVNGFDNDYRVKIIFNTVDIDKAKNSIINKFNIREKLGIAENEIVVGFAAGISKMKGAWDYLEMASKLIIHFPNLHLKFLVAGNPPRPQSHKTLLQKMGLREIPYEILESYRKKLENKLTFLGFQPKILDIISAFDILVIPTHLGALGRQPFEAMAVKTPVVVTAGHTGKSRIVLHERTGLVVSMKNDEELTDAVIRLIENPWLRSQLAEQGYAYAKAEFNPAINSGKVLQIYQDLTGTRILEKLAHANK